MPLDPRAAEIIAAMEAEFPPLDLTVSGTEMRRRIKAAGAKVLPSEAEPVARVENRVVPGPHGDIPVRVYASVPEDGAPLVVLFHGGGWVVCDLDSHDGICRALCNESGCVIVSVDYRLAPEYRFPIPAEDCYAATAWLSANASVIGADATKMAVVGDSAGGNLAAVVALMARDRGGPELALQVLVYPVTDHSAETASHRSTGEGYFLKSAEVMWYWDQYLADPDDGAHPYASPLRAESLAGLPPALIVTAEYDPLRDEGEAYGRRLQEAGVTATVHRYEGMFHSFLSFGGVLDAADAATREIAAGLRAALAPGDVAAASPPGAVPS